MLRTQAVACLVAAGLLGMIVSAGLGSGSVRADDEPFPMPKPGPEHQILKKQAGVWDATVESTMPDGKVDVSKGVETCTLLGDGLWVVTNFKGKFAGMDFEGHGINGYDTTKKKYVGTWVDSMTTNLSTMEETYDPATKTMSGWMDMPGPSGQIIKSKLTSQWKDDNTRVFTMSMPGPDGKDLTMMKISYKRRAK